MMQYFVLVLLISALIIGDVAGETRREALDRMLHSGESLTHSAVKRQVIIQCVYHPPPRPPPRPIPV
jgi:hypothetical protein